MKQTVAEKSEKWMKPSIKTISIQQLKQNISVSACSNYGSGFCPSNFYR